MVQVIDDPYAGNIFGRLGAGVGKGAADELSRQLKEKQLSSALEKLAESKEQNPLKQLAQLYGVPHITPEIANQAQTYLRQQSILNEAKGEPRTLAGDQKASFKQQAQQSEGREESSSQRKIAKNQEAPAPTRLLGTPEAISQGALNYHQRFPLRFPTIDAGKAQYLEDLQRQDNQISSVDNRFKEVGSMKLQAGEGAPTFAEVTGEKFNDFRKMAEDAVLSGQMDDTQAAEKYTKEMMQFARARDKIKAPGKQLFRFGPSPVEEIKSIKKLYDNAGANEIFLNDLIAHKGFSRPIASSFAYPPSQEERKALSGIKYSRHAFSDDKKVFAKVMDAVSPKDSLQTLAYELKKKGYDPLSFLGYAKEHSEDLDDRQFLELTERGSFEPSLSDIMYLTMSGRKPYD